MQTQSVDRTHTASQTFSAHNAVNPCQVPDVAGCSAFPTPAVGITDDAAREALVLEHLPMVRRIARLIHGRLPRHLDLDELISAGLVGLVDAADKYNGKREVQFKSYAQFRVRGAILDSLRSLDWSPRELRRQGRKLAQVERALSMQLGRKPSEEELAEQMGLSLQELQAVIRNVRNLQVESLNVVRPGETGDEDLIPVPAPAAESPFAVYLEGETRERLAAAIDMLPERERLVLTLYYFEELTLKETGLALGVVESRVFQIRASAVRRLRAAMQGRSPQTAVKRTAMVH